jgi:hypothetical protein
MHTRPSGPRRPVWARSVLLCCCVCLCCCVHERPSGPRRPLAGAHRSHTGRCFVQARFPAVVGMVRSCSLHAGLRWSVHGVKNNLLYNVSCHRVKMVCASNSWTTELHACEPADRAWLEAYSVLLFVSAPFWEPACVGSDPVSTLSETRQRGTTLGLCGRGHRWPCPFVHTPFFGLPRHSRAHLCRWGGRRHGGTTSTQ